MSLLERLVRPFVPKPDPSFEPAPRALAPGIWAVDRRLRMFGAHLPTRTTVVELEPRRLAVLSAPADACPGLESLGTVEAVIAPSTFHYVFTTRFAVRHPSARIFVAPGLGERDPQLAGAFELASGSKPGWESTLEFAVLGDGPVEVLFFHRPSRTLILTDLANNLTQFERRFDRVVWTVAGNPPRFGPSRNARMMLLRDRAMARSVLRAVEHWPFERIVVSHGDAIEKDARQVFAAAFSEYLR